MVLAVDIESLRTRRLRKQVGQKTFTRGCQYFASGRVVNARRDEDGGVVGTVTGSGREDYQVRIQLSSRDASIVRSECSCPYVHGICKHRVAVALAALADPTLRAAESAGWGRILDDGEDVLETTAGASTTEAEKLSVRLDLPSSPDAPLRVRLYRSRKGKRGWSSPHPIPHAELRRALVDDPDSLRPLTGDDLVCARLAGLLDPDPDHPNFALGNDASHDIFMRSLAPLTDVFIGKSDKRLKMRLEPVKPRVRVDSLKNQGLSLKIQIIMNGKRRTLDKRCRVFGPPTSYWLFDGEQTLMPIIGGAGSGHVIFGLSRKQARMPLREVPTFLERGLRRMRQLIKVEADPGVLPDVVTPEPLLILGEDGENLKVQLSFRYGDPVEFQVMSDAASQVLKGPDGHNPLFIMRDLDFEADALKVAQDAGLPVEDHPGTVLLDTPSALAFLEEGIGQLDKTWMVLGRERLQRFRTKQITPVLTGTVKSNIDSFDVNLEILVEESRYGLDALLQIYQSGRRYIALDDGTLALLPDNWVTHHLQIAMELPEVLMRGGIGTVPRYHAPVLDALIGESEAIDGDDEWQRLSQRLRNFSGLGDEPLPEGLNAELRNYQKHGYDWLAFLSDAGFHGILADDMGLGKTIQALTWILRAFDEGREEEMAEHPVLVVCPTSVASNWQREAERFVPSLTALRLTGPNRDKLYPKVKKAHIVITTYALLRMDLARLRTRNWHAIILDEAQNIKNPESQTAEAAKKIRAKHRLALTGTPLENNLLELWSVFDFLMPGFLDDKKNFRTRYVRSGAETPEDVEGLRIKVAPFMLRRIKDEVAKELPPKTEMVIKVPLSPEQQTLYDTVKKMAKQRVFEAIKKKGVGASTVTILDALLKLRQVACHPKLVKLDEAKGIESSSKHDMVHDLIEEAIVEGHRALVFSQFTSHLKILREWLDEKEIGYFYLDGRTRKRQELVDAYNSPEGPPLFLISLKAGGTGLNLTSADYVFHLDPWWNPAVEAQATDRAHRIGQTRPVVVYKVVSENTVEEKILELQAKKKELFDSVVSSKGSVGGSGLSIDDIRSIFDD